MQNNDTQQKSKDLRRKQKPIAKQHISERSSNILAKLSAIRGAIIKEDNLSSKLNDQSEEIQENTLNHTSIRPKRYNIKQEINTIFTEDLSSPLEIENIQAMERARRGAYSFRGRFNERAEVNESHDNINERRQQDRSPNERGAFRPMDVFQSRRGRHERGRSSERDNERGSDLSTGRVENSGKRSKSRERSLSQKRKRSRSKSPQSDYHKTHGRWKKFKQSQRVMLDGVQRKREIYDKRPEDHPDYPEEWRLFWEKRYKELQAQGKDADNHDYKTEWIPFWGKRVQEIYEAEIKVKTESMLHKYELHSANEPKKDDFQDLHPGNDELMVVGEYSGSSSNYNRSQNDRRDRDREKDDKDYDRDRQHRSNKDRERERESRNSSADRGNQRSGRNRRSRSKEREKTLRNSDSNRRYERNRASSPFYDKNLGTDVSKKGNNSRQSPVNQDAMSGLTVLENLRDRGVSRSPARDTTRGNEKYARAGGDSFNLLSRDLQEIQRRQITDFGSINPLLMMETSSKNIRPDSSPRLMETLRILTALEDILGSLGPQINIILSRAITLENNKEGSGNVLLEDQDIAAILQMSKEKLSGQIIAGLLEPQKEFAVRNCIDKLTMILQIATKNRPSNPPSLTNGSSHSIITEKRKNKYKKLLAEQLAKVLMKRGLHDIDDWYLHYLVYEAAKTTPLDDGSLLAPPQRSDNHRKESITKFSGPPGGYSTGLSSEKSSSIFKDKSETATQKIELQSRNQSNRSHEEFDDLNIQELKSLLDNFSNLSQPEQKDLVQYMKNQQIVNPSKVLLLKSSFPSVFGSSANENNQNIQTDGLGNAMLQVLARNVQQFTNDNAQGQEESIKREYDEQEELNAWAERITASPEKVLSQQITINESNFEQMESDISIINERSNHGQIHIKETDVGNMENAFQSTSQPYPASHTPTISNIDSYHANVLNTSISSQGNNSDLKETGPINNSKNNSRLSSALGAPPPPPPPLENNLSQGSIPQSQASGRDVSQTNPPIYNQTMAEVYPSHPSGFEQSTNNPFDNVQNNPAGFANYRTTSPSWVGPTSAGYPTGRGHYHGAQFNNGIRGNVGSIHGHIATPYGNNQMLPNPNQRPRFW